MRIENSPWAPLFSAVVEPNQFTATVEQAKQSESPLGSIEEFWAQFDSPTVLGAAQQVLTKWLAMGYRRRLGPNHVVLEAARPSKNGFCTVVAVYSDGRVLVPFSSYAGQNSGTPSSPSRRRSSARTRTRSSASVGSERHARTAHGWLTPERVDALVEFCSEVASAYAASLGQVEA